ncbi:hypothetical protein BDN72DRAFT_941826 [Pluteus cervinus]|uniref:Uncharacterized protein n=1 Tax=Pluteus cervinus TaxID=181527 RepID=A0ACD3AWQ4_9AGAR|nr:hypothetical protein BDN72DRAFT_941826 [Pluteus cervinus]
MSCLPTFDCFDEITDTKDIFPVFTTFALFSIDPVATVKDAGVDDVEVLKVARKMKPKRYLGYVDTDWFCDLDSRYTNCDLCLLSHGLPERNAAEGIEPDMCIALAPASNPSGRASFKTSRPLPFDNCYFHSHVPIVEVKVKTKFRRFVKATMMSGGQRLLGRHLMGQDESRRKKLKQGYMSQNASTDERTPQPPNGSEGLNEVDQGIEANPDDTSNESDYDSDMDSDEESTIEQYFTRPSDARIYDRVVISNISYKLSQVKDFDDPQEFFEERDYLQQLIRDAKARQVEVEDSTPSHATMGKKPKRRIGNLIRQLQAWLI